MATRAYLDHPGPIPFAHRGGAKLWPENTLTSFQGAIDAGYRWIETDIHMTADGEIVIFHDATLSRTTEGHAPIAELTLRELKRYDAGFRFSPAEGGFPFRGRQIRIPTLTEALELHPELRLNIEIKPAATAVARRLWEYIDHHGLEDRVLVASERTRSIRHFRRLSRGRVATSAGRREVVQFWTAARAGVVRALPIAFDALQVPVREGVEVVTPRFVQAAHRRGVAVHVWTIDDPDEMRRLLALGVDGLMTDRPDRLNAVMGR